MPIKTLFVFIALLISQVLESQDFSYDQKIGAQGAKQVEQAIGIYPDSVLNAYINQLGQRLAASLGEIPFTFQFHVVDMQEPNAFALPGGYIYVSRGILGLINSEDELAGVIGHEMIHVTKRHSVKQMKQGIIPGILKIPGALIGGLVNEDLGRIINTPVNLGSALFLSSYSRKQEKESDELGIKLASSAGYDPDKLSGVLQSLAAEMERESGEGEARSYFSSHPYTPHRVENINEKAPLIAWEPKPPIEDQKGFINKLDGMIEGPNPAQGIFADGIFMHPDMDIAIVFPEGWETANVPVAVAAVQPDGGAKIFISGDDPDQNPDSLGIQFAKALVEKYKIQLSKNESFDVNGFDGHVVSFMDLSGKSPVDIQLYWIRTEHMMLYLAGMGYTGFSKDLENTANSIRPLTTDEKNSIAAVRIRLVEAMENETLQSLSERSGNIWTTETLALMNGLDQNVTLQPGSLIKIAKRESYR